MMQITRKSSPLRGLTVLLALMLGAGLVLSGCGDDDSTTTTPAPAPAPPAPPAQPDPVSVPGGLTVSATGEDFIEFSWEAVEGASGYDIQMSMTEGDFSSSMMATVTATMHRFTVAPSTTAYARVRANMDGRESDWSGAVMGMSMAASLTLGTPMPEVSSTGPDHIEWTWDAVADAAAYQVRVAASADGLDMATAEITTATSHRVTAAAETTMYISVRAAAGTPTSPVVGDWSDAVAGTSDVAPLPFVVSMSPPEAGADKACSGQAFCPDSGTDPEKAMASVNSMMMVNSSHGAQVSAMFLTDAGAVALNEGVNTPFSNVSWNAMQSAVANDGVTFMFQRVNTAAGQEPTPVGGAMYITCGPFRCSDASDEIPAAPDITIADSAACTEFEVDLDLVIGLGYNGRLENDSSTDLTNRLNNYDRFVGIDAGWVYTSSSGASVVHEFEGVIGTGGGNLKVAGSPISKTSTPKALGMRQAAKRVNYFGGTYRTVAPELTSSGGGPIWNGTQDCLGLVADSTDDESTYGYNNITPGSIRTGVRGTRQRPENCFRIITAGRPDGEDTAIRHDYLPGYRVHVTPNASVTWAGSSVAWEKGTDPFEGLDCERVTFSAADQAPDLCETYREQVRRWWDGGIDEFGGRTASKPLTFEYLLTDGAAGSAANRTIDTAVVDPEGDAVPAAPTGITDVHLVRINVVTKDHRLSSAVGLNTSDRQGEEAHIRRASDSMWTSLWLVRGGKAPSGDTSRDGTVSDADLYRADGGGRSISGAYVGPYPTSGEERDVRTDTGGINALRPLWTVDLIDDDGDPKYGDFGKVDFHHDAPASNTGRRKADNFPSTNADAYACSDDDGTGCDATVEFDGSVTFTMYPDTDDCTEEIDFSFTCTWDADGDEDRTADGTAASDDGTLIGNENLVNFLKCKAS